MKRDTPRITVVGSLNMDLVVKTPRLPGKGETVFGTEFGMFCGGKGFNQAVAAARMGAAVTMVGRVGNDYFGGMFLEALRTAGVDSSCVVSDSDEGTGVGLPVVGDDGDNRIIVVPRANMAVQVSDVTAASQQIAEADVVLIQREITPAASLEAAAVGHSCGTTVVLNPAPAGPLDERFSSLVDIMILNEHETKTLTNVFPDTDVTCREATADLRSRGYGVVVLTLGERGVFVRDESGCWGVNGHAVAVADTTGAGDAFCGALVVGIAEGRGLQMSVQVANAAAALSVMKMGAYPSLPYRGEVLWLVGGLVS